MRTQQPLSQVRQNAAQWPLVLVRNGAIYWRLEEAEQRDPEAGKWSVRRTSGGATVGQGMVVQEQ